MTANENEINDALYVAYVRGVSDGRKQLNELKAAFAATLDAKESECQQRLATAEAEAQQWKQCAESARNILLATEEELRKTEAQRDALLDFAGTVAPGASWWEDIWEPLLKEQGE